MRAYNRRFARIARARKARGCLGRMNEKKHFMFKGFTFSPDSAFPVFKAFVSWMLIELKEGWRTWFGESAPVKPEMPGKVAMKPEPS